MLQIKSSDSLIDIIEKIEGSKNKTIHLKIPAGHPVLHNHVSLKILLSKAKGKPLSIESGDKIGKRIAASVGITVNKKSSKTDSSSSFQAALLRHNYSVWGYMKVLLRSYIGEFLQILGSHKEIHSITKYHEKYQEKAFLHIFILILLFFIAIFIFIYFFAINKSFIYIVPNSDIRLVSGNFNFSQTLSDSQKLKSNHIAISSMTHKTVLQEKFPATGVEFDGKLATGTLTVFNTTTEEITFVPRTRFLAPNGVIYSTDSWIRVPGKDPISDIAGTTNIKVIAREFKKNGEFSGFSGNIKLGTRLVIPGLSEKMQTLIYAQAKNNFAQGSDDVRNYITQNDIENAQEILSDKLKQSSLREISNIIQESNIKNFESKEILGGKESIFFSDEKVIIPGDVIEGKFQDNFEVSGHIQIQVFVYNREFIVQKLKAMIKDHFLEEIEKVVIIDESSLRLSHIVNSQRKPYSLKATFDMKIHVQQDFLSNNSEYIRALKNKIKSVIKSDAEKILLNDEHISNIEIQSRPFFSQKISSIDNNIIFRVE